jgi:hypothetical protein
MVEQSMGSVVLDVFEPHRANAVAAGLRSAGLWVMLSTNATSLGGPRLIAGTSEGFGTMVEVYVRWEDLDEARSVVDSEAVAVLPPEFTGPEIDEWHAERVRTDLQVKRSRRLGVTIMLVAVVALFVVLALS